MHSVIYKKLTSAVLAVIVTSFCFFIPGTPDSGSAALNEAAVYNDAKSLHSKNNGKNLLFISAKAAPRERMLIPGGQVIGVAMFTRGALVVGCSEINTEQGIKNPSLEAGLRPGDIIERIDDKVIKSAMQIAEAVSDFKNGSIKLSVSRRGNALDIFIVPVRDITDGSYKLGLWVRDSTAGVGTLTYVDPKAGRFGALGHAISDPDTGDMLTVKEGDIVCCRILDVVKGKHGSPGELKGVFSPDEQRLGNIKINAENGIFGKTTLPVKEYGTQALPAGNAAHVVTGWAQIISTIDTQGPQRYDIEIVKVNRQATSKSIVIKVVDKELLNKTGGIVQGMSGSPIIQNGRIIGAVTHVFINDPTRGYGVFIEWMLKASDNAGW